MPGRHQHHRQPKVYASSEKAHRHRGAPLATTIAAKTEAPVEVVAKLDQARSWFARIVGAVKNSVTEKTSASARLRRQLLINSVQQSKKLGSFQ
jgi:hypothetical protein